MTNTAPTRRHRCNTSSKCSSSSASSRSPSTGARPVRFWLSC